MWLTCIEDWAVLHRKLSWLFWSTSHNEKWEFKDGYSDNPPSIFPFLCHHDLNDKKGKRRKAKKYYPSLLYLIFEFLANWETVIVINKLWKYDLFWFKICSDCWRNASRAEKDSAFLLDLSKASSSWGLCWFGFSASHLQDRGTRWSPSYIAHLLLPVVFSVLSIHGRHGGSASHHHTRTCGLQLRNLVRYFVCPGITSISDCT